MILLDGKKVAEELAVELKKKVEVLKNKGASAKLTAISVGNHPASNTYLKVKQKRCEDIGIEFEHQNFPENIDRQNLIQEIKNLNSSRTSGIIVQLPLPEKLKLDQNHILATIDPLKDVDNLHSNQYPAPTPSAILKLLDYYNINLAEHNILIVGLGFLVGKPLARLLSEKGIDFDTADLTTKNLKDKLKKASLIISATGNPGLICAHDIAEGVVVIDAGTAESGGKIVGDVAQDVSSKASYLAPVPGGVGPVTIIMLIYNILEAAERGVDT